MSTIVDVARPITSNKEYRFFVNIETGNKFKAKQVLDLNQSGNPIMAITVSQIDADNKALSDDEGNPIVVSLTHIFTEFERALPSFNADAKMAEIINRTIEAKELDSEARKNIIALSTKWNANLPLV